MKYKNIIVGFVFVILLAPVFVLAQISGSGPTNGMINFIMGTPTNTGGAAGSWEPTPTQTKPNSDTSNGGTAAGVYRPDDPKTAWTASNVTKVGGDAIEPCSRTCFLTDKACVDSLPKDCNTNKGGATGSGEPAPTKPTGVSVSTGAKIPFIALVGIPGVKDPTGDFNGYINTLYSFAISIAALIAVIKIIIAGVKWMLSDVVTSKQAAKTEIGDALLGLLIIAAAFLILNQINPQLTTSNLQLGKTTAVSAPTTSTGGAAPLATGGTTNPTTNTTSGANPTNNSNGVSGGAGPTNTNTSGTSGGTTPKPTDTKAGYYTLGSMPKTFLPYRPAPSPTEINCTDDCTTAWEDCRNSGGTIDVNIDKKDIVECVYTRSEQLRCDEFTEKTVSGGINQYNGGTIQTITVTQRNCTPALSRCYGLTEADQRAAWTSGQVSCLVTN